MKLIFNTMDFKYELEGVVKLFFPSQTFKLVIAPSETGFDGDICFVKREKHMTMTSLYSYCRIGGNVATEADVIMNGDEGECEKALSRCVYKCLSRLTGKSPEWGILTGIRPVKQINAMSACGLGEQEIRDRLRTEWLCSARKINMAFAVAKVQEDILASLPDKSFSLYVSIPFCTSRCSYCSFVSQSVENSLYLIPQYVSNLCAELRYTGRMTAALGLTLDSVYFGGGTPTAIDAPYLSAIMKTVEESFDMSSVREYTVEAGRPDTVTEEKLRVIRSGGAGRISINPQTLNDSVLEAIGRRHTVKQFYSAFEAARRQGFECINTDIIAGLPTDTYESFCRTVDGIIALQPENITVHTLSVKRAADLNQTEDRRLGSDAARMLDYASDRLIISGYFPYYLYRQKDMLDNQENIGWAKPDFESIYNVYIMEENQTVIAVGAGGSTKLVDLDGKRLKRVFNYKYPLEYNKHFELMLEKKKEAEEFLQLKKNDIIPLEIISVANDSSGVGHATNREDRDALSELAIDLQDTEWSFEFTDHDRMIARAICFDDEGFYYFVRAERDDDFGKATLIETSGGGVETGEDLKFAIRRELKEELGVDVDIVCKIGVVSDYYNLIHRHNLNNYFLCRIVSFGDKDLTKDEIEDFHLSTLKMTYEEAVEEYEKRRETRLGRLIANRELPVLRKAKEIISKENG